MLAANALGDRAILSRFARVSGARRHIRPCSALPASGDSPIKIVPHTQTGVRCCGHRSMLLVSDLTGEAMVRQLIAMTFVGATLTMAAGAQAGGQRGAPAGAPGRGRGPVYNSPEVASDRRVTLRFLAPNAQQVTVSGELDG